jgi:hypothetical protein
MYTEIKLFDIVCFMSNLKYEEDLKLLAIKELEEIEKEEVYEEYGGKNPKKRHSLVYKIPKDPDYSKNYYKKNKDIILKKQKTYYAKNREHLLQKANEYYAKNRDDYNRKALARYYAKKNHILNK